MTEQERKNTRRLIQTAFTLGESQGREMERNKDEKVINRFEVSKAESILSRYLGEWGKSITEPAKKLLDIQSIEKPNV